MERKFAALNALYYRFGPDGLKDQPFPDVGLLLSSKELQFRDSAKDSNLSEQQKAANRQMELEIKDLTAYLKGQVAGISLADLRSYRKPEQQERQRQFLQKSRGMER